MSKPIFIMRCPASLGGDFAKDAWIKMKENPISDEYHILTIMDQYNDGNIKFECYNSPHTDIEFEELRDRVLAIINDTDIAYDNSETIQNEPVVEDENTNIESQVIE